jgi:adenylyl-sulfate kinase
LTGLSGSGKSTIGAALEKRLFELSIPVVWLDGDHLRSGLNSDLGFSRKDRRENIRRTAEVAKLFNQVGMLVITTLISPYQEDRQMAQGIVGADSFREIYISTPLEVCQKRDPHRLYQQASQGDISNFTGVSDPYQPPIAPHLKIDASIVTLEESLSSLLELIKIRKPA